MSENRVVKVSQLNDYIKRMFDANNILKNIQVEGEISNFKRHASSGHLYFSIKDARASINCVMFRSAAEKLNVLPENGQAIIAQGSVSVYTKSGGYQLYVNRILPIGIGNLQVQYEKLKKKLAEEGVFKNEYERRPIPTVPKKIGIVTSPTGAAIRDMIRVLKRRWPMTDILVVPASVQGIDGARSIVSGLNILYARNDIDLIIVGRGGGSLEDLWNFNEEPVVRTIAQSPVPIISAVGHEIDVTLSDFAADLRAGTPSIAAELAVPNQSEVLEKIHEIKKRLGKQIEYIYQYKNDIFNSRLSTGILQDTSKILGAYIMQVDQASTELDNTMNMVLLDKQNRFSENVSKLDALSPLRVLGRGYSYCEKNNNAVISVKQVAENDILTLRFTDGFLKTEVKEISDKRFL